MTRRKSSNTSWSKARCPKPGCLAEPQDYEGLFKHLLTHERPWRCTSCNIDRVRRINFREHVLKYHGRDLLDAEIATAGAYHLAVRVWADGGAFLAPGRGSVAPPMASVAVALDTPSTSPTPSISPTSPSSPHMASESLYTVAIRITDDEAVSATLEPDSGIEESNLHPKLAELSAQEAAGTRCPTTLKYPYC